MSGDPVSVSLRESIESAIEGCKAEVVASGGGHFSLHVTSSAFEGKGSLDKQRMVYSAIAHLMKGESAPVHAIDSLRTETP